MIMYSTPALGPLQIDQIAPKVRVRDTVPSVPAGLRLQPGEKELKRVPVIADRVL